MTIIIIRHGKVQMRWPDKCDSKEFDDACARYDFSEIENIPECLADDTSCKIYVSTLKRSMETAKVLFPGKQLYELPEIIEVPLKSFRDTNKVYPLWLWNGIGRIQWLLNSKRQTETRKETSDRADKVIDFLENKGEDCILITHGFFMNTFLKKLKKRGYLLNGERRIKIGNLQRIVAHN